jgi:hypothetical protein
MIHRYEFDENKKLHDDILKAYYVQHGKGGSEVKLEGGKIRFEKRKRRHRLQKGSGFESFLKPVVNFLLPSVAKGISSLALSKATGNSLKDSLKKGVSSASEDMILRQGKSLLMNALNTQ